MDFRRRFSQDKRETEEQYQKAVLEAFWLAGDFYNQIDMELRSHALRGLSEAENEDFWRLARLREDARETMEEMAVYAMGGENDG
jgi:hypothetical protein